MSRKSAYLADGDGEGAEASAFNIRELLTILMERAWLGLLVALAVFLLSWLDARRQTPYYRSTARLIVEAQIPQLFNFQDILAFNARSLEYFNTHLNALHSRPMMERALELSGLKDNPAFLPNAASDSQRIEAALGLVKITPVERSRMINLSVEHPDPQIASDLANALARSYIQQDLDNRMSASMQAVDWLRQRTDEYREKLEKGLLQLQEYREQTQSVSLEEDQNIVIAKLKALNSALTSAQTGRIEAETRWRAVESQLAEGTPLTPIVAVLDEPAVQEARSRLGEQRSRVEALRQRYRPEFPDLQQAMEEEKRAEQRFREACESARQAMKSRFEMLKNQEAGLQAALVEQEKESFELDRRLVRYNDLKRNIEADEQVYQAMIGRMKEASLSGTLPTELIRIAEEARPARRPFRPNVAKAGTRGALLGLVLGLGAIFVAYVTDHRFRRSEDVERRLGVPVMGTVPLIEAKSIAQRGLASHHDHMGEVAEAFRTLRASLVLSPGARAARVLMITSPQAAEGKSLVATNLAIAFAQDNRRTLLVGCDLRRPVLEKIFEQREAVGLAEVLKGEAQWQDVLLPERVPGLDVICSGRIPSRPTELLGSPRFDELIAEARQRYERIIIDAPPMLGLSDSLVLLPRADSVLFVVRYGVTHSLSGIHAMRKIVASGSPCHGAVLNGVNLRTLANSYYYRRYGSYAYKAPENEASSSRSKA